MSDLPFPDFLFLAELNAEMILKWNPSGPNDNMPDWTEEDLEAAMYPYDADDGSVTAPLQIMPFVPTAGEKPDARGPPIITELHALLLQSRDRLFFIANCIPRR